MNRDLRLLHMPSLKPRQHSKPGPLGCNGPSQGSHFRILSPTLLKNSISPGKLCKEAAHAVFWATQGQGAGRLIPPPLQRGLRHTGAAPGARPPPSAEPLKGALAHWRHSHAGQPWSRSWWQKAGQLSSLLSALVLDRWDGFLPPHSPHTP